MEIQYAVCSLNLGCKFCDGAIVQKAMLHVFVEYPGTLYVSNTSSQAYLTILVTPPGPLGIAVIAISK